MRGQFKDETGNKHGRLLVLSRAKNIRERGAQWTCLCDCGNTVVVRGRHLRYGTTQSCGCLQRDLLSAKRRDKNSNWKGGFYVTKGGYVHIYRPNHPHINNTGYVYEHIVVMEKMIGCAIPKGAVIHHCNGDKTDNRPYNLRLFKSQSEHAEYHMKLRGIGG